MNRKENNEIEETGFEEVYEIRKYGTYYSENRFWKKVVKLGKKVGAVLLHPALLLFYLLEAKTTPLQYKAYIIGALGYFIFPFDFIPESVLPVIGFTDDIAVINLVISLLKKYISEDVRFKADAKIAELFPEKD